MSNDDEDTWRKRRPVIWDDDKRALQSASRRRTRDGIPAPPPIRDAEEITAPHELIDRPLSISQVEIIRQSKRNGGDHATVADVVKLADMITKERSESRQRDAEYNAVLQAPHEIAMAIAKKIKTIKWIVAVAMLLTGGGAGLVSSGALATTPTPTSQADQIRIEQLHRDVNRLDAELREIRIILGRRSALGVSPTFPTSTKGIR